MAAKCALVTGGAGFIGSHLCEHLLTAGWRVAALDDLSTGAITNVRHLEGQEGFRLFVGSAAEADLLYEAGHDAEFVYHLAAVVGVKKVIEDPVAAIEKNLRATEAVLRFCNRFRRRLLITSTSEVYGDSPKEIFSEDDASVIGNSRHRRWSYAAAKLLDEFHAFAYFYSSALPVTIVRLFNTIGPRQVGHYGMVVPTFIGQALRGEPITIFGDGEQRRCFTGVRDAIRCLAALAQQPETAGQVYNVGAQEEISIRQLAETIKQMTASASPIVFRSYHEAYGEEFRDMRRRVPDVRKLRAAIGFTPDTPLATLLAEIIAEMRKAQP